MDPLKYFSALNKEMQVKSLYLVSYSYPPHNKSLSLDRRIDKCSFISIFVVLSICIYDPISAADLWEIHSRASCTCILSARMLPCSCKTAINPGAVLTGNSEFYLMETSSNVIFQRKAILIQGDPDTTWCEIANIIKPYDISASVWVLSESQPAKEKDAG